MSDLPDPRFLDERVAHWAELKPDEEAITYLDRSWTWSQWNDRVRRLAGALAKLGIKRGDVVAFVDKNHPACVEATFGRGVAWARRTPSSTSGWRPTSSTTCSTIRAPRS